MFCSLLRDFYLYILQICKILSCDDPIKLLNKYLHNKDNKFIFDIRSKSKDFQNIFEKISNEINNLNENNICKQTYKKIKNILDDHFLDDLCNYVHHNHYIDDHPFFFICKPKHTMRQRKNKLLSKNICKYF